MADTEELGLEVFVEGWQKFEQILDKLDRRIDDTGQGMQKTGGIAGGAFAVGLGNLAANAAMALGDALLDAGRAVFDFGADSVQMAADFQSQMAILQIAASSTGLSFDDLHDAALQVGGDTSLLGVSATGAADSMTGLFKAGLTTGEVFGDLSGYMEGTAELGGALRAAIDLAAASELDMVQASDLAAIALSSFGGELETEEERAQFINDAMNNMVMAADASVAEVSGLAEALKMVGPTAGAMGIGIEDVNNGLALLSTRGIQGSMAGTSLNRMLLDITKTTPKAQEMMDKLGISIYDQQGAMLPLVDIIGQFEGALGDATEAERNEAMQAIFTAQGQRAMNTLIETGAQGWYDMADATANAATIQEQAEARGQTFNAQMEALEGTVETLKIGIGEQFLPVAQELIGWFAEMVDQHGPQLQAIFEQIAAVITNVIQFLMGLLETGDPLNDFFAQLPEPIQAFISFMTDSFVPALQEVWAFVMEQVAVVVAWWQENVPLLSEEGNKMLEAWERIKEAFGPLWEIIKEIVSTALSTILSIITLSMQVAQGDWSAAWDTIVSIAIDLTGAALSVIENFFELIANLMGTTMEEIRETWKNNWEMAKIIVSQIIENIKTTISDGLETAKASVISIMNNIVAIIRGLVGRFRQAGSDLINGLVDGIKSAAQRVVDAARQVVQGAIQAAQNALQIGSPSRVAIGIGEEFDRGVAIGLARLAPMVQAQMQAVVQAPAMAAGAAGASMTTNVTNNYNLTTQSLTRPGGLALEFQTMSFASR